MKLRNRWAVLLLAAAWLLAPWGGAMAAQPPRFVTDIPEDVVREVMDLARENLSKAHLPDGSPVPEETPEMKRQPIIPLAEAKRVVEVGMLSAVAAWCGVEWRHANFAPFMAAERASGGRTDKALTYIGLMHGVTVAIMQPLFAKRGECSTEQKQGVENFIAARWK